MGTLKFKTNLKCSGCVSAIQPYMDKLESVENWKVNLEDDNKILTVEPHGPNAEKDVPQAFKEAGYEAEPVA